VSVLIDASTRLLVQGITGRDGSFHTRQMLDYGTRVVAGVTPGKGGTALDGVPVFDTVARAVRETGANASVVYVPAPFAGSAILEAAEARLPLVVAITEGIPANDVALALAFARDHGVRLLGPNCPGAISPGLCKVGIIPGRICTPGPVGVVSRSGTLTYEIVNGLTAAGVGQSTCVGIGGDPLIGTSFVDCLRALEVDPATRAVVLIGEIGGRDEQDAAAFAQASMTKPVVAFVAGRTAPPGRRMGHAGAIVSGAGGSAREKVEAFEAAGIPVAETPSAVVDLVRKVVE
jgi:succinyl-CoA synthetase alpha subunit